MSGSYTEFLASRRQLHPADGFEPTWLPDWLFGFQHHLTDWAIRQGRSAVLADCGLGKTPIELVWASNVHQHTGRPVLILTPLAVSFQAEREAVKFGIDAAVSRDGSLPAPVTITNYERLDRFQPGQLGGVVCDESSILKSFDGTRQLDVIHRAVVLWTNPGERVLTPFMGVGSEVFEAVRLGRYGVGVELKPSYYVQAVRNLAAVNEPLDGEVEPDRSLFDA